MAVIDELAGDDRVGERDQDLGEAGLAVLGVGDVDHVAQPAAQGLVAVAGEALDQELGLMEVEYVELLREIAHDPSLDLADPGRRVDAALLDTPCC